MNTEISIRPWYREPWPWFILGILGLGVCSGLSVLIIGLKNPPQIMTGDYAPLGKALVDTHERSDRARALGLSGELLIDADRVILTLASTQSDELPDQLLVQFIHPASSERDMTALVQMSADGRYLGTLSAEPHQRARIIVANLAQTWWLSGRLDPERSTPLELNTRRL